MTKLRFAEIFSGDRNSNARWRAFPRLAALLQHGGMEKFASLRWQSTRCDPGTARGPLCNGTPRSRGWAGLLSRRCRLKAAFLCYSLTPLLALPALAFLTLCFALTACSPDSATRSPADFSTRKIKAVCTIGMITDIVQVVGGDRVEAVGLMGAGVDPHLYKASEGDVRKLAEADIIFYNGLNLEGKMGDLFVRMSSTRPTIPVTEGIDPKQLREPPEFAGHYDPHVWFDATLWISVVKRVAQALAKLDPAHAADYAKRASAYNEELQQLDKFVSARVAEIPKDRRVLVTAHDAFGYFGQRYDIEVVALQGISTATEAGVGDVKRIVDLVVSRKLKAIFVESSVPQRTIEAVIEASRARGHKVAIGGSLFSDALGDNGTPEGNYTGMIRHNVNTIADALK